MFGPFVRTRPAFRCAEVRSEKLEVRRQKAGVGRQEWLAGNGGK